jgi:signal transduction histidine kinase
VKVLAVDDDVVARMAVRGMVTALGHECLLAQDGAEAWELLRGTPVDVVITDRVMPDLDGLELCRRIRAAAGDGHYTYIVLASAMGEDDQAREGMVAGADDYLAKPLRLRSLELKLIAAQRVTALHQSLARINEQLTAANQLQADVMAMLGHDARQPLAGVIGYVEGTLEEWATTPDEVKVNNLTRATDAARRLDQLIEDVLTMGNLDAGAISTRPAPVTVSSIVSEAVAAAAGRTPVTIHGDATALVDPWHFRQVMTNLIGNAVKYGTPPVTVTVRSERPAADEPGVVNVEVSDRGEGVPAEFVPHLFERFARACTGVATLKNGTGFGLYIVRRLVEVNSGRIEYTPADGGGAAFVVTLPAAVPALDRVSTPG